jgi:hypothetical protein
MADERFKFDGKRYPKLLKNRKQMRDMIKNCTKEQKNDLMYDWDMEGRLYQCGIQEIKTFGEKARQPLPDVFDIFCKWHAKQFEGDDTLDALGANEERFENLLKLLNYNESDYETLTEVWQEQADDYTSDATTELPSHYDILKECFDESAGEEESDNAEEESEEEEESDKEEQEDSVDNLSVSQISISTTAETPKAKATKEKTAFTTATTEKAELLCLRYGKFNKNNDKTWHDYFATLPAKDKKKLENARKEYQKGKKFTLIHAIKEEDDEIPKGFDTWCDEKKEPKVDERVRKVLSLFGDGEGKFEDWGKYRETWDEENGEARRWDTRKRRFNGKRKDKPKQGNKLINALLAEKIPLFEKWLTSDRNKTFGDKKNGKHGSKKAKVTRTNNKQKIESLEAEVKANEEKIALLKRQVAENKEVIDNLVKCVLNKKKKKTKAASE